MKGFFDKYLHIVLSVSCLILCVIFIFLASYYKNTRDEQRITINNLQNLSDSFVQRYYEEAPEKDKEADKTILGKGLKDFYHSSHQKVIDYSEGALSNAQKRYSEYHVLFIVFIVLSIFSFLGCIIFFFMHFKKENNDKGFII